MSEPFMAEVRMFACNYAPRGWAFCAGQKLSIADNSALYSLLGTHYGGDGRTTVGLPDLRGRAPMHSGQGPGLTRRSLSEKLGTPVVRLDLSQTPEHNHELSGAFSPSTSAKPRNNLYMGFDKATTENIKYVGDTAADTPLASDALTASGQSDAHYNQQPFLAVNFCIALEGIYPSRN